jgi:hypothetical protein
MATLTVNTTLDVNANDSQLTLREAIDQAAAGDLIIFDPSLNEQTIFLDVNLGPLVIDGGDNTTIDGDIDNDGLPDITVDGEGGTSLLVVQSAATADITGLRFANGSAVGSGAPSGFSGAGGTDGGYGGYGSFPAGDGGNGGQGTNGFSGGIGYSVYGPPTVGAVQRNPDAAVGGV